MNKGKVTEQKLNNSDVDNQIMFDDDNDESTDEIKSKTNRVLNIKPYDRMVEDIIGGIESGRIDLNPDYQRNYVWSNTKASMLIESILLNIPIPPIYASENNDGTWVVVDGLQRLNSLHRFLKDEFILRGLETLSDLNGYKYSKLDSNVRSIIDRYDLRIILLLRSSDKDIQYDVFSRLNSGSVSLNPQELRNCLYRGKLNDLVKNELRKNQKFMRMFNLKESHNRMNDSETILRYLAFSDYFDWSNLEVSNYDGRVKNIINKYMIKYNDDVITKQDLERISNLFIMTIEKVYAIFHENAFRKDKDSKKVNRPLMDAVMLSFEKIDLNILISHKEKVTRLHNELLNDENFIDSITTATGNSSKTNYRIKTYYLMLKDACLIDE